MELGPSVAERGAGVAAGLNVAPVAERQMQEVLHGARDRGAVQINLDAPSGLVVNGDVEKHTVRHLWAAPLLLTRQGRGRQRRTQHKHTKNLRGAAGR